MMTIIIDAGLSKRFSVVGGMGKVTGDFVAC